MIQFGSVDVLLHGSVSLICQVVSDGVARCAFGASKAGFLLECFFVIWISYGFHMIFIHVVLCFLRFFKNA